MYLGKDKKESEKIEKHQLIKWFNNKILNIETTQTFFWTIKKDFDVIKLNRFEWT